MPFPLSHLGGTTLNHAAFSFNPHFVPRGQHVLGPNCERHTHFSHPSRRRYLVNMSAFIQLNKKNPAVSEEVHVCEWFAPSVNGRTGWRWCDLNDVAPQYNSAPHRIPSHGGQSLLRFHQGTFVASAVYPRSHLFAAHTTTCS